MRSAPICTDVKGGGQDRNPGILRYQRPQSQREGSGLVGPSPVGIVTMDQSPLAPSITSHGQAETTAVLPVT